MIKRIKTATITIMASYGVTLLILGGCTYKRVENLPIEPPYNPVRFKLQRYIKDKHISAAIADTKYPYVLAAIAKVESDYRPLIKGDNGESYGLYQIQQRHFGVVPETLEGQSKLCERIIDGLLKQHNGDLTKAIRHYNGSGRQARIYQAKVLRVMKEIRNG
jgi:hypothetical protein